MDFQNKPSTYIYTIKQTVDFYAFINNLKYM